MGDDNSDVLAFGPGGWACRLPDEPIGEHRDFIAEGRQLHQRFVAFDHRARWAFLNLRLSGMSCEEIYKLGVITVQPDGAVAVRDDADEALNKARTAAPDGGEVNFDQLSRHERLDILKPIIAHLAEFISNLQTRTDTVTSGLVLDKDQGPALPVRNRHA